MVLSAAGLGRGCSGLEGRKLLSDCVLRPATDADLSHLSELLSLPAVYEYLQEYFRTPNQRLFELIGEDYGW